jgi:hypothetical protein
MANTFSVQTSEVRRRVVELTHALTEVTQARIRAAAESPLDGGLEECVGQAVAFGAMFHAAALQLPPAESVRDYIQALVSETLRDMVGEPDKPLIYGANNEIANATTPATTPDEALARLEDALSPPDTSDWACLICACTDDRPCPGGCRWVAEKICSACAPQNGIKIGTLQDFVGEPVVLTTGEIVMIKAVEDGFADVGYRHALEDEENHSTGKLWAGTGCILFTGESIYGDG